MNLITRNLFRRPLMTYQFATRKNYYEVLNVEKTASADQVKQSYRELAKKYHPDVNTTGQTFEPNNNKFQEIAEAYAILSQNESRNAYDLLYVANPNRIFKSVRETEEAEFANRGADGNPSKPGPVAGSYAEERRAELAEERKRFNVDAFGRYKGGLPVKGMDQRRKNVDGKMSLGYPQEYHDPLLHNILTDHDQAEQRVDKEASQLFSQHQYDTKWENERRWTYWSAEIDYKYFKFSTYQTAWRFIRNVAIILIGIPVAARLLIKKSNRGIIKKYTKYTKETGNSTMKVNGRNVIKSKNGIVQFE